MRRGQSKERYEKLLGVGVISRTQLVEIQKSGTESVKVPFKNLYSLEE